MASITKRGKKWLAQVRRKGYRPRAKLCETKREAEAWANRLEARISVGDLTAGEAHRTTLEEALERYLKEVTPTKKGARQETNRILAWQRHELARKPLAAIRSLDIAGWRDDHSHLAPSTIKNALAIVSRVYATAAAEWGMEGLRNPVRGVRMPKARAGRDRRLSHAEEENLLKCAENRIWWLRPLIVWAIETGMRLGEILELRRDDISRLPTGAPPQRVDVGSRTLDGAPPGGSYSRWGDRASAGVGAQGLARLRDSKNGRGRVVPVSSRAMAVLEDLPTSIHGKLFPVKVDSVEYQFRKAREEAECEGLRFHDLRHEAISRWAERGFNQIELMGMSGHRTPAMLARYVHLDPARLAVRLG